jgi:phosphoglycerol transferase MdoB-like AlkP superfamily enzyme
MNGKKYYQSAHYELLLFKILSKLTTWLTDVHTMLKPQNTTLAIKPILAAAIWIAFVWILIQLITWLALDVTLLPETYWKDYLAHLLVGGLLYIVCRSWWSWAIAFALFMLVLQVCNALKLVILGTPTMPDDFISVKNMFHLFGGWRLLAMWAALLLPISTLFFAIAWFSRRTQLTLIFMVVGLIGFSHWPSKASDILDGYFGNSVWNQPANFQERGLLIHLLQESAHYFSRGNTTVNKQKAQNAFAALSKGIALDDAAKIEHPRNVYVLLLESFWDPMPLKAAGISQDPLDPRFRKLWKKTQFSQVMSPVFGGYTANSEFEQLCGFPVNIDAVFFEGWLRNEAPCLPRYLTNAGYHTIAAHPNYAAFWNRVNAYYRLGFTSYWAEPEFKLDDMNRDFLSDASLYRQMWEKIQPDLKTKTPIFAHIVTFFGHMDYPLNGDRPPLITVKNDPNMVEAYVNLMYYKSRELMDFVELLQKQDPDALIVMYGDHLPYLGPNYDGYVESGLLKRNKSEFTPDMFNTFVSTPLIMIDGQKGPVMAGQIPIYKMPSLMLKLLGDTGNSFVSLTQHMPTEKIRPLPGITLSINKSEKPFTCEQSDAELKPECASINEWLDDVMTVNADVFSGDQYSLEH